MRGYSAFDCLRTGKIKVVDAQYTKGNGFWYVRTGTRHNAPAHVTPEQALEAAEKARKSEITKLKSKIARLEAITFQVEEG